MFSKVFISESLEKSSYLSNSGEFKRQTASEIAIYIHSFLQNCSDTQSVSSWFYKKNRNKNLTEMEKRTILFLYDGFRNTDISIYLIANAFRVTILNIRLFSIFSSFIFCSIIYLFEKRKEAYSCLPSMDSLNYSLTLFKGCFDLWSFYLVQNASCSFTCI